MPKRQEPDFRQGGPRPWMVQPFLHVEDASIYNPLRDRTLGPDDPAYGWLRRAAEDVSVEKPPEATRRFLIEGGWLVPEDSDPSTDFHLQYVEIETTTRCNQACYFCPVSTDPREPEQMSLELFRSIVDQLEEHRDSLLIVNLFRYNEPTVEPRLVEFVSMLRQRGLPPAMNTNATGLTPKVTDALIDAGGLRYLSVNLHTLDRERYARERRGDHLPVVLRNLDYLEGRRIADRVDLAVLGGNDKEHERDFQDISERFGGFGFEIKKFEVMNRADHMAFGKRPPTGDVDLCGCLQTGSRPLQWLHITPRGQCVLCCQDYNEEYVVGDLRVQTVQDVLTGPEMARMRRWVYGLEDSPEDFICRKCIFARTRPRKAGPANG